MQKEIAEKVYDYLIQGKLDVVKYIIENQVINCFGTYQDCKTKDDIEVTRTLVFFVFDDASKIIKEIVRYKSNAKMYFRSIRMQSKDIEICQENFGDQFDIDDVSREYWFFKI
jgi:hypothetical protein